MADVEQNRPSYEELCANFRIDVPEYYNFGFDVVDAWAKKDRNKLAMIWVDQKGNEKKYTFRMKMSKGVGGPLRSHPLTG